MRKLTEFGKLRRKLFITKDQAAALFEVTGRTVTNWDRRKAPTWAVRQLQRQDRSLAGFHPAWTGFKIGWDGVLYGPERIRIKAAQLREAATQRAIAARLAGGLDREAKA